MFVQAGRWNRSPYAAVKPAIDLVVAAVLLLLSLPLMLLIALAVSLDSPGPVLFRQVRVGRGGAPFTIYKFRTMLTAAPAYAHKIPCDDPLVTPVGRWLRKAGLDELPQLVNVLLRDMSLIGPRPEMPFIVAQYQAWQRQREVIRPGITGWWQIHHRNEVPMHLDLEYDLFYLEHFSFWLDCKIAWRTALVLLGAPFRRTATSGS
jgi:lipopolysaccharide/colanic/teichoic acid biosynthesis glycosyltransferase